MTKQKPVRSLEPDGFSVSKLSIFFEKIVSVEGYGLPWAGTRIDENGWLFFSAVMQFLTVESCFVFVHQLISFIVLFLKVTTRRTPPGETD